mgnify:CR=1 FL=1|tara:strand:- start:9431 stop:14218 length:4788 start_codon:yes stop_codon:yes gene_type:complete
MAQPLWMQRRQAEGVQRTQPTGFSAFVDDTETENEKREKERRGFSVGNVFGTALSGLGKAAEVVDKYDFSLAEKAGLLDLIDKIPDLKGTQIDDWAKTGAKAVAKEGTRLSTFAIAAGGVGLGAKAGTTAARLGARAAAKQAAGKTTQALTARTGQGALKATKMLTEPMLATKGASVPARFGAEVGLVGGFSAAAQGAQEIVPEDAPTWAKAGVGLGAGLLGGVAGGRASINAMRRAGMKVDNAKGLKALGDSVIKQQDKVLGDALPTTQIGREAKELNDQLAKNNQARDVNEVRRNAYLNDFTKQASEDELFIAARNIEEGRYPYYQQAKKVVDPITGTTKDIEGKWVTKEWGDVPAYQRPDMGYLGGRTDSALLQSAFEGRRQAASSMNSRVASETRNVLDGGSNKEFTIELDGKRLGLNQLINKKTGRLDERLKDDFITIKEGDGDRFSYTFTEKGEPLKLAIQKLRRDLDVQLEAEKQAGLDFGEITGEMLEEMPEELQAATRRNWEQVGKGGEMPYFGDLVERLDENRGYFPRFASEGLNPNSAGSRSFGRKSFEKGRRTGFSDGSEFQRQMWENNQAMEVDTPEGIQAATEMYLGDINQVLDIRRSAGYDRMNAQWFKDALTTEGQGIGGLTPLERIMQNEDWAAAREVFLETQKKLKNIVASLVSQPQTQRLMRTAERLGRQGESVADELAAEQVRVSQSVGDELDSVIRDFEVIFEGDKSDKIPKRVKKLKAERDKMRAITQKQIKENPAKLMGEIDEAGLRLRKGIAQLDNNVKGLSRKRKLALAEKMGRDPEDALFVRDVDIDLAEARSIEARLNLVERLTNEINPSELRRNKINTAKEDLAILKPQLANARKRYNNAKDAAGALGAERLVDDLGNPATFSGRLGKIDNMSFAGRLYDADFAQDMNKYLNQAEDVGITKYINTFNNIARPFMATLDLSSVGIQGLLAAGVHPIRAARYMTYAMASLFNPKIWDRFVVDNADEIDDFIRGGGYWSDLDDAGDFMFTKGVTSLPAIGKLAKISNHHFSRNGNAMRLMMYKNANDINKLRTLGGRGALKKELGYGDREQLIEQINNATGFKSGKPSDLAASLMFAPRFFNSQLNVLSKAALASGPEGQMARDMLLRTLTVMSVSTWAINKSQNQETDFSPVRFDMEGKPQSNPNFMRVRVGGKDYSLFGSWDSLLALFTTGVTQGPAEGVERFLRTKASPAMARVYDVVQGETFTGDQVKFNSDDPRVIGMSVINLMQQNAPFALQDMYREFAEDPDFSLGDPSTYSNPVGLGLATNILGVKSSPLTPSEIRDVRSEETFGREWRELNKGERAEIEQEYPEVFNALDKNLKKKADLGDTDAVLRVQKQQNEAKAALNAKEVMMGFNMGTISHEELDSRFKQIKHDLGVSNRAIDEALGINYATSDDPVLRARNRKFEIIQENLLAGKPNWPVIEELTQAFEATLPEDVLARYNTFEELEISNWPESSKEYFRMDDYINKDSGYWDQRDIAFDRLKAAMPEGIDTYDDLMIAINRSQSKGERAKLKRLQSRIDSLTRRKRTLLRRKDEKLDVSLVLNKAYTPVTKEGREALRRLRAAMA